MDLQFVVIVENSIEGGVTQPNTKVFGPFNLTEASIFMDDIEDKQEKGMLIPQHMRLFKLEGKSW